eukprot:comp24108_c1_seq2/m.43607 comp24108_c1_seq2/g.43607  ORF comp24108_c1_seq2/g.43607 comp24108_c1_seq2/m.43607 type:complete len:408 (-) comp24108_c1_seq2:508-1731(-)
MGGEKFAALQPEAFLFGAMTDVSFLPKQEGRHGLTCENYTVAISAHYHLKRATLRLVKVGAEGDPVEGQPPRHMLYRVEFAFDALQPCNVTLMMGAVEDNGPSGYQGSTCSPSYPFDAGCGVAFTHDWTLDLSLLAEQDRRYGGKGRIPLVILIEARPTAPGAAPAQAQATLVSFEESGPTAYVPSVLKQKITVYGSSYMLQEIYGMEEVPHTGGDDADSDDEDENRTCVVCMSDHRDTLVLPCRHLCLCAACAQVLRNQAAKCPICRAPFHSLLQLSVAKQAVGAEDEVAEGAEVHEINGVRYHCVPIISSAQPLYMSIRPAPAPVPPSGALDLPTSATTDQLLTTPQSEIELQHRNTAATSGSVTKKSPAAPRSVKGVTEEVDDDSEAVINVPSNQDDDNMSMSV